MEIGNKILELRKKNNLSQEDLAEKVGVARQTISKWELGETAPDLKQAKLLSTIFKVSLDELTGNDVKEVLIEKVSNTEKLAGIVIKILKIIGILIIVSIIVTAISIITLTAYPQQTDITCKNTILQIEENVGDNTYYIEVGPNGYFNSSGLTPEMEEEIFDLINFDNPEETEKNIQEYFVKLREEQKSTN